MAYKFQMGSAVLSGALEQMGSLDSVADGSGDAGFKVGGVAVVDSSRNITGVAISSSNFVDVYDGKLRLAGTAVTAKAAELNYLDIASLGTAAASKALVADGSAEINASAITFTNLGTVTTVDLNGGSIDGTVIGAAVRASGSFHGISSSYGVYVKDGMLRLAGTAVTAKAAELNYLDIASLGTAAASKALVADGSSEIDAGAITFTDLGTVTTVDLNGGSIDGTVIGGAVRQAANFTQIQLTDNGTIGSMSDSDLLAIGNGLLTVNGITLRKGAMSGSGLFKNTGAAAFGLTLASSGSITAKGGLVSTLVANSFGASSFGDANITNVGDIALDSISADGTSMDITLTDNDAAALEIKEGSNAYMTFVTTDGASNILVSEPMELDGVIKPDGAADETLHFTNDKLLFRDADDSLMKASTWTAIATAAAGTGVTATNGVFSVDTSGGDSVTVTGPLTNNGNLVAGLNFMANISADAVVNLPQVAADGDVFIVKLAEVAGAGTELTIRPYGAQTIDGLAALEMESPYGAVTIICNQSGSFRVV
jgi:regulator of RNase E activity RraA